MSELIMSELRQRVRGRRWWIALAIWTLALLVVVWATRSAAMSVSAASVSVSVGSSMFAVLALFTIGLACLLLPSLTAGSINGERQSGTLAALQVTLYRPHEIYLAKLAAAGITSAGFLAATLPLTAWCLAEGGVPLAPVAVAYLMLLLTCVVLAALGLATSALVPGSALSAVAAYAVVFALTFGTLIAFSASYFGTADPSSGGPSLGWRWVLIAPNPFFVVTDAMPSISEQGSAGSADPLSGLSPPGADAPPLWQTGLAIQLVLAALASMLTIRRLAVPARRLRSGERVA